MDIFMREIKLDIKHGMIKSYKKYIPVVILGLFFAGMYVSTLYRVSQRREDIEFNFTLADIILYMFEGVEEYKPNERNVEIPVEYMMLNLYLMYIIGDYVVKDLLGYGKLILMRTQKKIYWWLAKCIWCVLNVILFYAIIYACMIGATLIFGNMSLEFTPEISKSICRMDLSQENFYVDTGRLLANAIILPVVTAVSMMLFQMTIGLIVMPVIGYVANVVVLVVSVFSMTPLLQGNAFMMMRNDVYLTGGINGIVSAVISCMLALLSVVAGGIYFERMDILKKSWKI